MIYFFTVAAPARSGTMWFSRLLTTEHSFCYHELTSLTLPYPSNVVLFDWYSAYVADHDFEQAQRRWLLQYCPGYFPRLWERAFFGQHIVGNSDPFVPRFLPALWLLWPDMKFVFSFRNGILCVQSHVAHRSHWPELELTRLRLTYETEDFFNQCCHLWVEQVDSVERARGWLDGRASCFDTTLERMTGDLEEVRRLWDWIGIGKWEEYEERSRRLMQTPINARTSVGGVVGWPEIWERWTNGQRDAFLAICGDTQVRLGYPLP